MLYNMEDRNIKWMKVVEENTQTTLFKLWGKMGTARQIIFGTDMGYRSSWKIMSKNRVSSVSPNQAYNRVTPEAGMYYIPNGKRDNFFATVFSSRACGWIKEEVKGSLPDSCCLIASLIFTRMCADHAGTAAVRDIMSGGTGAVCTLAQ